MVGYFLARFVHFIAEFGGFLTCLILLLGSGILMVEFEHSCSSLLSGLLQFCGGCYGVDSRTIKYSFTSILLDLRRVPSVLMLIFILT